MSLEPVTVTPDTLTSLSATAVIPLFTSVKVFSPCIITSCAWVLIAVPLLLFTVMSSMVAVPLLAVTVIPSATFSNSTVSTLALPSFDSTLIAVSLEPVTVTPDTLTLFSAIASIPLSTLVNVLFPLISMFCASTSIAVPSILSALMFSMFTVPLDSTSIPFPFVMSLIVMSDNVMLSALPVIADPPLTLVNSTPLISTLSPVILNIPSLPFASMVCSLPLIVLFSGISTILSPSWNT